jgi:hypothetical protein
MRTIYLSLLLLFCLPTLSVQAQDCTGSGTSASEGSFDLGYEYSFTFSGDVVTATFTLLDPRDGLVAFAQTYNPDFAEVQMFPAGDPANQTFTANFPGQTQGGTFQMACKFAFAGGLSTTTILIYEVGVGCGAIGSGNISLPITFEDGIDYELADFGGNVSELVTDPTDPNNTVVQSTKTATAEL